MGDDAIALVLDLVEERAARRHVVDGRGERVDVGADVELDGVEHLLRRDVAGRARDEPPAHLGRDADRPHHAEVDDHGRERLDDAGIAVLSGSKLLAPRERQAQPDVRRLDVAVHEPRPVQRREPRARVEHDLAQLEERHGASGRVLLQVRADQVLEHQERHARPRRRDR